jgi:hypothetical protein
MIEGDKMIEETNQEVVSENTGDAVENTDLADDVVNAETVFFVVKNTDGSFRALTDVSTKIKLARPANLNDIRFGCGELVRAIDARQTADTVVALLASAIKKQEPQA